MAVQKIPNAFIPLKAAKTTPRMLKLLSQFPKGDRLTFEQKPADGVFTRLKLLAALQ